MENPKLIDTDVIDAAVRELNAWKAAAIQANQDLDEFSAHIGVQDKLIADQETMLANNTTRIVELERKLVAAIGEVK
jgi:hypothetical protein